LFRIVLFQIIYRNLLGQAGKAVLNLKIFFDWLSRRELSAFFNHEYRGYGQTLRGEKKKMAMDEVVFASILLDERSRLRVAWRPIYLLS
jgi:hypothetical protein